MKMKLNHRGAVDVKVIVIVVVAVAALACAGMWVKTSMDKKTMESQLNAKLTDKTTEADNLKTEVEAKVKKIEELGGEIKKVKDEQAALVEKVKQEQQGRIDELTAVIEENKQKVEEAKKLGEGFEKQLADAKAETAARDTQINGLNATILTKDTEIAALNTTIGDWQKKQKEAADLAEGYKNRLLENKIPLEPDKKFKGHILVVNKSPEFVILDLGSRNDIPVGTELKVVRDNHYIGKITVQKLLLPDSDRLSYATVTTLADPNNSVREGDAIAN
ncbi:hypothetical protein GX586_04005 [bacterium]|nr:hypothetical protein [bacterium]